MAESTALPFVSPKRKRDSSTDFTTAQSPRPYRLRTDLPSRPLEEPTAGNDSPRTTVTGQLQALRLQHDPPVPTTLKPLPEQIDEIADSSSSIQSTPNNSFVFTNGGGHIPSTSVIHSTPPSTPPRLPSTPHLKPVSPSLSRNISPLPHTYRKSPPPPNRSSPPPVIFLAASNAITSRSPSPSDAIDLENLGLNGIGFRPTPAMAYARTQRRRQQVAEWNRREANEARQRRSELRRKRDENLGNSVVGGGEGLGGLGGELSLGRDTRRVRFVEG